MGPLTSPPQWQIRILYFFCISVSPPVSFRLKYQNNYEIINKFPVLITPPTSWSEQAWHAPTLTSHDWQGTCQRHQSEHVSMLCCIPLQLPAKPQTYEKKKNNNPATAKPSVGSKSSECRPNCLPKITRSVEVDSCNCLNAQRSAATLSAPESLFARQCKQMISGTFNKGLRLTGRPWPVVLLISLLGSRFHSFATHYFFFYLVE